MNADLAIIVGASGGIGTAVQEIATRGGRFKEVWGVGRKSTPPVDLTDEESIIALAERVKSSGLTLRMVFDATGYLHGSAGGPEKSWSEIDSHHFAHQFAVNATGPALLLKHLLPLLDNDEKAVFATISAKVGSISDNRLGGWYGYRAAKAALNQIVKTASIELARKAPDAIVLALHPGTVETPLSAPFAKFGLNLQTPHKSAAALLAVIDRATPEMSGSLVTYDGKTVAP